jgi:hypothetical protein
LSKKLAYECGKSVSGSFNRALVLDHAEEKLVFLDIILKIFTFINFGIHMPGPARRTFNRKFCHMARGRLYGEISTIYDWDAVAATL